MKSFFLVFAGLMLGVAMTLSCDDDSPARVDAAPPVCDCAKAEPPITEQRVIEVKNTGTLPPVTDGGGRGYAGAACSFGYLALSGSCQIDDPAGQDIVLVESISSQGGWNCSWKNNTNAPVVVRATVRCLQLVK
jgi:hypothetical protein